jgi:hypothetical protein
MGACCKGRAAFLQGALGAIISIPRGEDGTRDEALAPRIIRIGVMVGSCTWQLLRRACIEVCVAMLECRLNLAVSSVYPH